MYTANECIENMQEDKSIDSVRHIKHQELRHKALFANDGRIDFNKAT